MALRGYRIVLGFHNATQCKDPRAAFGVPSLVEGFPRTRAYGRAANSLVELQTPRSSCKLPGRAANSLVELQTPRAICSPARSPCSIGNTNPLTADCGSWGGRAASDLRLHAQTLTTKKSKKEQELEEKARKLQEQKDKAYEEWKRNNNIVITPTPTASQQDIQGSAANQNVDPQTYQRVKVQDLSKKRNAFGCCTFVSRLHPWLHPFLHIHGIFASPS